MTFLPTLTASWLPVQTDLQVSCVPILSDNYVWVMHSLTNDKRVYIVDPGDAKPVIEAIETNGWQPQAILNTHRHWDHVNGIATLVKRYQLPVYAPATETIPCATYQLVEGDRVEFKQDGLCFQILEIFGHTEGHIAYLTDLSMLKAQALFSGDTLFSVGCGRLLGGTAKQLDQSLQRLAKLPGNTAVYCTHEYTLANLEFAKAVGFNLSALKEYERWCVAQRQQQQATVPTTIAREIALNPFLNPDNLAVTHAIQQKRITADTNFAALRHWKDNF